MKSTKNTRIKHTSTEVISGTGMLMALMFVLNVTGLGKILIPPVGLTTLHIPVIIATLIFGLYSGMVMGAAFGLLSFYNAYTRTTLLSLPFQNIFFALIPRICIALVVFLLSVAIKWDNGNRSKLKIALLGIAGSLTNTVLVLSGMGLYYETLVVEQMGIAQDALWVGLAGVAAMNGIPEAIFSAIIVTISIAAWRKVKGVKNQK